MPPWVHQVRTKSIPLKMKVNSEAVFFTRLNLRMSLDQYWDGKLGDSIYLARLSGAKGSVNKADC